MKKEIEEAIAEAGAGTGAADVAMAEVIAASNVPNVPKAIIAPESIAPESMEGPEIRKFIGPQLPIGWKPASSLPASSLPGYVPSAPALPSYMLKAAAARQLIPSVPVLSSAKAAAMQQVFGALKTVQLEKAMKKAAPGYAGRNFGIL